MGSCSYVACEIALSFYDAYWNDNIIENNYEAEKVQFSERITNATNSPGNINERKFYENFYNMNFTKEEYLSFVENYKSRILHCNLLSIGIEKFQIYDQTRKYPCGTFLSTMRDIIKAYLDGLPEFSSEKMIFSYKKPDLFTNQEKLLEIIKTKVKEGVPVIIDGSKKEGGGAHSFVAYDYDSTNDIIYVHSGYLNKSHVGFEELGYTNIQEILYFEPRISSNYVNPHVHSDKYYFLDSNEQKVYKCTCSLLHTTSIEIENNYVDFCPTFRWNSFIKEIWHKDIKLYNTLSILDSSRNVVYKKTHIYFNSYSLTDEEWLQILKLPGNIYFIYIGLGSDFDPYWDDYGYSELFKKPCRYLKKSAFLPKDWGFEARYYFQNELSDEKVQLEPQRKYTTASENGLTINTERLRCGYIENSYIVLSPRRENAGEAYFEMNFNRTIYSFAYKACLWSYHENLDGKRLLKLKALTEYGQH